MLVASGGVRNLARFLEVPVRVVCPSRVDQGVELHGLTAAHANQASDSKVVRVRKAVPRRKGDYTRRSVFGIDLMKLTADVSADVVEHRLRSFEDRDRRVANQLVLPHLDEKVPKSLG